jgi:hypothetical protein
LPRFLCRFLAFCRLPLRDHQDNHDENNGPDDKENHCLIRHLGAAPFLLSAFRKMATVRAVGLTNANITIWRSALDRAMTAAIGGDTA